MDKMMTPELLAEHRANIPIKQKQKMLISICKSQLMNKGIFESESAYRDHLMEAFGVGSITQLAEDEASMLIDQLVRLGAEIMPKNKRRRPRVRRPQAPNLTHMVSPQQLHEIERLKADVLWKHQNGFNGLVKRVIKKDKVITGQDASKMIEAMKGIIRRQNASMTAQHEGEPF